MSEPTARTEAVSPQRRAAPRAGLAGSLERLEEALAREPVALREVVEPLLDEVRQGLAVLEPGSAGARPAPKEREALGTRLVKAMDRLEDVLEGLRLAFRADAGGRRD